MAYLFFGQNIFFDKAYWLSYWKYTVISDFYFVSSHFFIIILLFINVIVKCNGIFSTFLCIFFWMLLVFLLLALCVLDLFHICNVILNIILWHECFFVFLINFFVVFLLIKLVRLRYIPALYSLLPQLVLAVAGSVIKLIDYYSFSILIVALLFYLLHKMQ